MLVLVIGDLHIPTRAAGIPETFRKMLSQSGRIQQILCCGNINNQETFDYLKTICPNILCARGEYDEFSKTLDDVATIELEELKFGVLHGHQVVPWGDKDSLAMWQRKLDVDVLVAGNTHVAKFFEFDGKLFLNPGSMTGAPTPFDSDVTPSFLLLDVQENKVICFTYSIDDGEMKIKKKEYSKDL